MRADNIKTNFVESAKQQLGPDVTDLFYCYEQDLVAKLNEAMSKFDQGIAIIEGVMGSLTANKVEETNETLVKVRASLADARAGREKFAVDIEQKFVDLHAQQESFFKKMFGG